MAPSLNATASLAGIQVNLDDMAARFPEPRLWGCCRCWHLFQNSTSESNSGRWTGWLPRCPQHPRAITAELGLGQGPPEAWRCSQQRLVRVKSLPADASGPLGLDPSVISHFGWRCPRQGGQSSTFVGGWPAQDRSGLLGYPHPCPPSASSNRLPAAPQITESLIPSRSHLRTLISSHMPSRVSGSGGRESGPASVLWSWQFHGKTDTEETAQLSVGEHHPRSCFEASRRVSRISSPEQEQTTRL